MRFNVTVGELARVLGLIGGVVPSRTTIPILTHVLIKALPDGRVSVTGTDLERECTSEAPAEVAEAGAAVLHGAVFKSLVTNLPKAATLTVACADDGKAICTSSRSRFRLNTLEPADFPEAKPTAGAPFRIDAKKLRAILEATIGSVSTEETRYYLCGVFLHIREGALTAASTDGHRLSRRSMDLPAGAESMPGVIIPSAGVTTMMSLLEAADGDVELWVTPARLWLRTKQADFSTALINGTFPAYDRAVPQYNGAAATFLGEEFRIAVERAAATLPDAKAVGAGLTPTPDGLIIKVGPDGAEAAIEHIDAEFHGKADEIAANAKYLAAMTKIYGTAPIDMHVVGAGAPIVFTSRALPEQLYVVMPMRR